jgi:hypothetical protein
VDVRVKTFVQEAVEGPEFLRTEDDFAGPETEDGESGAYPLLPKVQYRRDSVAAEAREQCLRPVDRPGRGCTFPVTEWSLKQ